MEIINQFLLKGDFRFFWSESIKDFVTFPTAWDSSLNTGLGQSQISSLWVTSYFNFTTLFTKLGFDWNLIQVIFWILPAFFISFFSAFSLFNYLFKEKKYSLLSGLIYSLNTYFLMILTGGQLGISLAYSIAPLVLKLFIKLIDNTSFNSSNFKLPILAGLLLALQVLFDPRLVYITLVVVVIYSLFNFYKLRNKNLLFILSPFLITILLNSFWILPLVLTKSSSLLSGFNSAKGFEFFSFANLSNSLSLLHPNFPENIFGKVYFLDPKFLILPIIAFSSLLFKKNRNIIFFSTIALIGVFLAKGSNPPFGEVNVWLFQNFPGMSMFRDPSKFYVLIALSYSILIPFSLIEFSKFVKKNILLFTFILYFLVLIIPVLGQLKFKEVSKDYVKLKNLVVAGKTFSRTLWIPKWQRFGYFSNNHPAIGREELFKGSAKRQISMLDENLLKELSVQYIIVPYDSESEIFLKDRKYNEKEYQDTVNRLRKLAWIKEVQSFNKLKVFELPDPKDHFWSPSENLIVQYSSVSPTEYKVQVREAKKSDLLIFSEGFDKNWVAESSKFKVQSSKFENRLNSFTLPQDGDYALKVYYEPQKYVEAGLWISGATLLVSISLLSFGKKFKKW